MWPTHTRSYAAYLVTLLHIRSSISLLHIISHFAICMSSESYVFGPCIIVIVEEWKTNLMSLAILFNFLCSQHVSEINVSIIRSLRLFCLITALVVLFLVRCVLEFRCGWVWVVSVLQDTTPTQPHRNSKTHRTKNNTTIVVIQQNSRKLLMMDILISETCWAHKKWNKITSDMKLVFYSSTITMLHGPLNIRFTVPDVVLIKFDLLMMSTELLETCTEL